MSEIRRHEEAFERAELILKYLRRELSEEENVAFHQWLDTDPANKLFVEKLEREEGAVDEFEFLSKVDTAAAWKNMMGKPSFWQRFNAGWRKYITAAAIILIVGATAYLYRNNTQQKISNNITQQASISPGGNKAILTLADGKKVVLDTAQQGKLAQQGNTTINKVGDGQLQYGSTGDGSPALAMNKLETPKGGQYQLTLPDGTKVWLNAASSITFPTVFSNSERKVEITGEAYFEVAELAVSQSNVSHGNARKRVPFLVASKDQVVEVLGTHFNINSYADEPMVKTTLLKGSVNVRAAVGQKIQHLLPGEEADVNKIGGIKLCKANIEQAMAWRMNKFVFDGDNIESIMRKVARWYDVEVVYKGDMSDKDLVGSISRFKNIAEVLQQIELTGIVHFKTEGRRVTVMP